VSAAGERLAWDLPSVWSLRHFTDHGEAMQAENGYVGAAASVSSAGAGTAAISSSVK
jgi:hypothetical protein